MGIKCSDCPYNDDTCGYLTTLTIKLAKIGAMAILRQNRKSKKREFDPSKVLTCITADQVKKGMKGYFADNLIDLKKKFNNKVTSELLEIRDDSRSFRFRDKDSDYTLFYPID